MKFGDYTLTLDGKISSRLDHFTESLDQRSVEMFQQMLETFGDNFRRPVPGNRWRDIEISWAVEGQAALAAFSLGRQMVTITALLSGRDKEDDDRVLRYFREILAEEARPRELPAPHLADISERPVVLSIPLPTARPEEMSRVGNLEVCLAAAFFERRPRSRPAAV